MMSAKPSVWSPCMCVKNNAFNCAGVTSICERRMLVPRPASNCGFPGPQLLLSSPTRTSVPAPACPLKTAGPLCVPVSVTMRQGAACAAGAAAHSNAAPSANLQDEFMDAPSLCLHVGGLDHLAPLL